MIDPWREGQEALVVGLVGPHVGPLVEERAVEALTLAVRLRPERTGALVAGADIAERRAEGPRDGVVLGVVGHDPLDAHTLAGEPGGRLAQEARAGHPALIGEGGDVGDPAHVVDGVMEEVIAAPGTGRATAPTPEPMTAALGDPPELLDVDVEQLARSLLDVADRHARGAVLVAQPGEAVAAQDVADRRARHAQHRREAVRSQPQLMAGAEDGVDADLLERAGRADRPRAAVLETGETRLAVAADPFRSRLPAHPSHVGGVGDRPALDLDPLDQELPAKDRQFRPTMHRESLPMGWSQIPQSHERGLSHVNNVFVNHI